MRATAEPPQSATMTREQRMGALFAVGSACFIAGPFPGYADLVGPQADAITFFVGSIFFTLGGAAQTILGWRPRYSADWWTATVQSAGTLCFNVSTFLALQTALGSPQYDRLVWRPDAVGSTCFLISGSVCFAAASKRWWAPTINLLGCVLFGIAAIAGYVVPQTGSIVDLAAANGNTALGAACFCACAVGALRSTPAPAPAPAHA
jgi:hypothetical protein